MNSLGKNIDHGPACTTGSSKYWILCYVVLVVFQATKKHGFALNKLNQGLVYKRSVCFS